MSTNLVVYRWKCPICSEENSSMSSEDRTTIEGLAENAFRSHVRTRDGDGHAREGDLPSSIDRDDFLAHVEFDDDVDLSSDGSLPHA